MLVVGMKNPELTIRLPGEDVAFLQAYAREHGLTLAGLVARYVAALRAAPRRLPHPANLQFTGTVPAGLEARAVHSGHLIRKHR